MNLDVSALRAELARIVALPHGPEREALVKQLAESDHLPLLAVLFGDRQK